MVNGCGGGTVVRLTGDTPGQAGVAQFLQESRRYAHLGCVFGRLTFSLLVWLETLIATVER